MGLTLYNLLNFYWPKMSFYNQINKVRRMIPDALHKTIIISLLMWSHRSSSYTHTILYICKICHILFHCVSGSLGNSQTPKSLGPWLSSTFINSCPKTATLMMLWQPDSWQVFSFTSNVVINLLVHKSFTFSGKKKKSFSCKLNYQVQWYKSKINLCTKCTEPHKLPKSRDL